MTPLMSKPNSGFVKAEWITPDYQIELRPTSLLLNGNGCGISLEAETSHDCFHVTLGPEAGFLQFKRFPKTTTFLSHQWLADSSQAQGPLASIRGVLWSRQAAREADRDIAAYLAGLDRSR
jgi:hypothetical protein